MKTSINLKSIIRIWNCIPGEPCKFIYIFCNLLCWCVSFVWVNGCNFFLHCIMVCRNVYVLTSKKYLNLATLHNTHTVAQSDGFLNSRTAYIIIYYARLTKGLLLSNALSTSRHIPQIIFLCSQILLECNNYLRHSWFMR